MIWTIKISAATPSGNTTLRQHWAARASHKVTLGWLLASALNHLPKIPDATGRRRLTITRHGKRALDRDNLSAGMKGLIDVIKERHLIIDDRPQDCELVFEQKPCGKAAPWVEILLEEIAS